MTLRRLRRRICESRNEHSVTTEQEKGIEAVNGRVSRLERMSPLFSLIMGLLLVLITGVMDWLTGYELSFSLFYLIPISMVSWFSGRGRGLFVSVASACSWFLADMLSGHSYGHPAIAYWNTAIRFGFFLIVALLLAALRAAHQRERDFARVDNLTGAANARAFSEVVNAEIERARRNGRPFTVAYVDLDNFKTVNDRYGHSVGDRLLCEVVREAKARLRKGDTVARLGGDEFAFLLPETDEDSAREAVERTRNGLLGAMRRSGWPVTFSIGVLTCSDMPQTSDDLIRQVDAVMYMVKDHGKNAIRYSVYAYDGGRAASP